MAYVNYQYYVMSFLLGTPPRIPEPDFGRWERAARLEIVRRTGLRESAGEVPAGVKDCACAVAEVLYEADRQVRENASQGLAGPLASWSNDGQSGSVDLSGSLMTEAGKTAEVARLCRLYLAPLGLLYRGVMHCES